VPNFQLQALPVSDEGASGIDILLGVTNASVVFLLSGSMFEASLLVEAHVFEAGSQAPVTIKSWSEQIVVENYEKTQTLDVWQTEKRVPVTPGSYLLQVVIEDLNTGKRSQRHEEIVVHDMVIGTPAVGDVRIHSKQAGHDYLPVMGVHLQGSMDSLVFSFSVYNVDPEESAKGILTVVRYKSDTTSALPPYAFSATSGSLVYRGIDEPSRDTIYVITQEFSDRSSMRQFQAGVATLDQGIYEITPSAILGEDLKNRETVTGRVRTISVMGKRFPKPETIEELIEPLRYIARESEWDSLRNARKPELRRSQFEAFWLKIAGSPQAGSNLIKQYYTRVEEANLYFSSFEEGWRTDRGMIYIVLGPPLSVQTGLNGEVWRYSTSDDDFLNSYFFRRVPLDSERWPFEHYVLERQPYYDQPWIAALERWRRGWGY
jgi:GWxTD domain-containing protein